MGRSGGMGRRSGGMGRRWAGQNEWGHGEEVASRGGVGAWGGR